MTASVKLGIAMLLVLALVGTITGDGWAGGPRFLVQIDDLTDTVTLTVSTANGPLPPTPTILAGSVGEFLHFTLPLGSAPPTSQAQSRDLLEGVGGPLSDRLLITHAANSSLLDVQFASDPATIALPPGVTILPSLVETGTFQTVAFFFDGANTYEFQVRSDLASSERGDVPAPATLLLLGSGLAALAGAARRRRRK
jgi:PEP-CTERM motif-containing protein